MSTEKQGEIFFPKGCPSCGGKIVFKRADELFKNPDKCGFVYCCENYPTNCTVFVSAHKETKGEGIRDYPIGILADDKLRILHDVCRNKFNQLWLDGNNIKRVYKDFVVGFTDENGESCYGVVDKVTSEGYILYSPCCKEPFVVPLNMVNTITARTKAYFWLSIKMGIPFNDCKIPMFDKDATEKAISIIEEAILNLKSNNDGTKDFQG
jgi:hypothetical protein